MKFIVCIIAFAALASCAMADPIPFTNCGAATDPVSLESVDVSPFPLTKGTPITFTVKGNLAKEIDAGNYKLSVKYLGISLLNQDGDVCKLSPQFPCPFKKGPVNISQSVTIPNDAPSGDYEVNVSATDKSNNRLLCIDAKASMKAEAPVSATLPKASCALCEKLIAGVQAGIKAKKVTPDQIMNYVKLLCTKAPAQLQQQCQSEIVNNLGPKIVALLEGDATPEQVCTQLKLCKAAADAVIDADEVAEHNKSGESWEATTDNQFFGKSVDEIKGLMGLQMSDIEMPKKSHLLGDENVPASFDARTAFKGCIGAIKNQGKCGSCWAVSASEVLADRLCIGSGGKVNKVLSAEELVSCDHGDNGCGGGMLPKAWEFMKSNGLPTSSCFPYTAGNGTPSTCATKCVNSEPFTKYHATQAYQFSSVADIKKEIMLNGPVQAGFMVYKSLMSYKSGVYKKKWYEFMPLGGHAIKILGWGNEGGVDYWLVANSWGTTWGESGFFKIAMGQCRIEDMVYAGKGAEKQ